MGERRFSTKNRFVSFLLAIAMVLTLLPIGAVQAKAEETTVKLYFELPQGTKVTDWYYPYFYCFILVLYIKYYFQSK